MPPKTPGSVFTQIPKFLIDQVSGAMRSVFGQGPGNNALPAPTNVNAPMSQTAANETGALRNVLGRTRIEPWMGPGQSLQPMAPRGDVAGRAFDYPVGYNISTQPRQYEGLTFQTLRNMADGLDLARLCIETRKNQMSGLTWDIVPRMKPGQNVRNREDPRCQALLEFFRSPDRRNTWDSWMRMLMEDMLVLDAPSIYVRRTVGGDVYALEIVDGSTIQPLLDRTGRTPIAPMPAFNQILKGLPAINYTTDELLYFPRNVRPGHFYGCPPIQQIFTTLNIAIRREIGKLSFYTEGNIPEAIVGAPPSWTPDQIKSFQQMMDALVADQVTRRRMIMVPGGTNYVPTRAQATYDPQQDEWFARVICYAFDLPPLPLVQQMNRNTSETSYDTALAEGLTPTIIWLKGVIDYIISHIFGYSDIEFTLERKPDVEDAEVEARNIALVQAGIKSIDEARAEMGLPALGMGNAIFGGPNGVMFLDDLIRAHAQGALAPQMPAPPDAGLVGPPGMPPGAPPAQMPSPASSAAPINMPAPANDMPAQANNAPAMAMPQPRRAAPATPDAFDSLAAALPPGMLQAVGIADPQAAAQGAPKRAPKAPGHAAVMAELMARERKAGKK
jgi:hypothetical protein